MTGAPLRPVRVVAAGECMLELSREGEQWRLGAAGDSFNTALYLARLGAQVRYLTALGTDPFSEQMRADWSAEGIDLSLVLDDPERLPGLYAIRTDAQGERSFYYWRERAAVRRLFELPGIDAALQAAADCDLLYLTGITLSLFDAAGRQRWLELARQVRGRGGCVAFDPNYRPRGWSSAAEAGQALRTIASAIDIVLTTDEDERALWNLDGAEGSFAHWQSLGVAEVGLKRGAQGALVRSGGVVVNVPSPAAVQVVDTTGAGDSFNAAYLMDRLQGAPAAEAARAGHRLAGRVVQTRGAILPRGT